MTRKRKAQFLALVPLLVLIWSAVRVSAVGNVAINAVADDVGKPYRRAYSLRRPQGEVLATLLRLDVPFDTTVKTRDYAPRSPGIEVIITAPKRVHEAIGPLVDLLTADGAAKDAAEARVRSRETEEKQLRSIGLKPQEIERSRKERDRSE